MSILRPFLFLLLLAQPLSASAETLLLMAEEDGCSWCETWDEEISHIYPKTAEGRAAPLRRFDLHDGVPARFTLTNTPRFTPTFILIEDGIEVGRIEGYPGEDFFWALLAELFKRANIPLDSTG